jgi:hypothetical protein
VATLTFRTERCGMLCLALWRTVVFVMLFATLCVSWATTSKPAIWPAYLTHWGAVSTMTFFGVSALSGWLALYYFRHALTKEQLSTGALGRLCRATTILFELATSLELLIVALYWSVVYRPQDDATELKAWVNCTVHAACCGSLLADLLVSGNRPLDLHAFLIFSVGLVYMVVNAAVSKTVQPLYAVLTWDDGKSAVVVVGGLLAVMLNFTAISFVALLRDRTAARCHGAAARGRGRDDSGAQASLVLLEPQSGGGEGCADFTDLGTIPCTQFALCRCPCRASSDARTDAWVLDWRGAGGGGKRANSHSAATGLLLSDIAAGHDSGDYGGGSSGRGGVGYGGADADEAGYYTGPNSAAKAPRAGSPWR